MHIQVIDPVRNCYWCGVPSEKIFRAEAVHADVPHMEFCACSGEHALRYVEDVQTLLEHIDAPAPLSWRMKQVTNWYTQEVRS